MLSKSDIIKRLNKEIKKSYRNKTLIVLAFSIILLLNIIYIDYAKGFIIMSFLLISIFLYRLVDVSAKRKIGFIYINNKFVCRNLKFFYKIDDDKVRCYIGIINIRKIEKMRDQSNNLNKYMRYIRDERGIH